MGSAPPQGGSARGRGSTTASKLAIYDDRPSIICPGTAPELIADTLTSATTWVGDIRLGLPSGCATGNTIEAYEHVWLGNLARVSDVSSGKNPSPLFRVVDGIILRCTDVRDRSDHTWTPNWHA